MHDNIRMVSERGDRLENLQDKTDNLAHSAQGFHRGANRVRKVMWWKDMKMRVCLIIGIIILLIVIIVPVGTCFSRSVFWGNFWHFQWSPWDIIIKYSSVSQASRCLAVLLLFWNCIVVRILRPWNGKLATRSISTSVTLPFHYHLLPLDDLFDDSRELTNRITHDHLHGRRIPIKPTFSTWWSGMFLLCACYCIRFSGFYKCIDNSGSFAFAWICFFSPPPHGLLLSYHQLWDLKTVIGITVSVRHGVGMTSSRL